MTSGRRGFFASRTWLVVPRHTRPLSLPEPHPAFAAHVTDAIYEDQGAEAAPFGSDEGAEVMYDGQDRRGELRPGSTIDDVLGLEPGSADETLAEMVGIDYMDQAALIRGAAFTLLRLVGHLEAADLDRALRCLAYEIETTADPGWLPQDARDGLLPALHRQRDDLRSWRNPSPDPRPQV